MFLCTKYIVIYVAGSNSVVSLIKIYNNISKKSSLWMLHLYIFGIYKTVVLLCFWLTVLYQYVKSFDENYVIISFIILLLKI